MSEKIKVVLDAMGGDNAPWAIVEGAVSALRKMPEVEIVLCGDEAAIRTELGKYKDVPMDRITVRHCSEVIETAEPPVSAIRTKKDSSIVVGLEMVRSGQAQAFISSGSTGAVLVGGTVLVGRIPGVERAPLAVIIPNKKGISLLVDGGANVDSRPSHLVQFAQMGSIYMRDVCGIPNPTVGIVNIGAEEDKGNALVKETFPLLKALPNINFIGSVEARDIPSGAADVIVCDAFVGNVVLKMYEGTASTLLSLVKSAMTSSLKTKIGALLVKDALKDTMATYDATQYGGAPLVGIKGLVVKTHGNVKAREIEHAIGQSIQFSKARIPEKIAAQLGRGNRGTQEGKA